MRTRTIPGTSIYVSEIGFGCWTMGGPNWSTANGQPIGWGEIHEPDVLAGIKAGIEGGVNHWDNADIYGNGRAERILADCFRTLNVKRESQVIATKVGHAKGTAPHAYLPRHIRNQCEQSLVNLRTDYIDLYYFHHGTFIGPGVGKDGRSIPDYDYLPEAAATMHALVKEGKVRAVGQSAYTIEDFERAIPVVKPQVLQNKANLRYDDFIRPGSRMQQLMETHNCAFVAFGPLDQGILLDKFDADRPPAFEEGDYRRSRKDFAPDTLRAVHQKLAQVKQRFSTPNSIDIEMFSSVASRWVLSHPRILSTIPGFRNERQARANLRAAIDPPMSDADAHWLRTLFSR